jgi:superfamily II DNA or RNA helicase
MVVAPNLRPYQHGAIASVHRELAIHRSTLVVAATGTGKTVTFAELARMEVQRAGRVLILVNRDELVRQARRKCEAIGLWPDVEKGKYRASTLAKVVLASVQSLRGKRLERWARAHFTLIIVDEAHHAPANSYQTILSHFTAKVVGFTATAARADGKELGDTFESVAHSYDIRTAIRDGFLVPVVARRIVVDNVDLRELDVRAGDFAQDQLAEAMSDERALRGVAIPLLEQARDRLTIAFCVNVAHAHALADVLNTYRPGCARAVSGETDDDEREHLLASHSRGEFQFLVNCDLLVEGYDCPEVACVAMCRPTQSWARFVQCAGRGLRPAPWANKRDCLILDFTGTAGKHALIGPADCLRAANENIPDDVRAEIERQLEAGQLELEKVVKHAADEVRARRARMRVEAVVRYHSENIDPFIGAEERRTERTEPAWEGRAPTERQLEALEKQGVVLKKLPKSFSMADASRLLGQLRQRHQAGLCSYKMAKRLASLGVKNTQALSAERAAQLRDLCLLNGWHPSTLADQPEVRGESRSFVEGAVA